VFTQICKFFALLQRRPGWLFVAACLATAWAMVPLRNFEVRASVTDLLPSEWESVRAWKSFGNKLGSAGHLAIVVHSPDAAANASAVERLAGEIEKRRDVNFLEYRTEAEFYRHHKLLYITLDDLREIERRVETGFWLNRSKHNPLITSLLEGNEKAQAFDGAGFEDMEAKYFSRLKDALGSPDSTTLVLRVYPTFDATDIHACRAFLKDVEALALRVQASRPAGTPAPEILYTGDVVQTIYNEGKLFSRVLFTTRMALLLSGLLLLVNFLRFPVGALLALVPVAMATVWTAALTWIWIGPLGIVSAPLSLLLIGLGLTGAVHLLARYSEERRKRLSASVAFETITLETGPALTAGLTTLALAFLTFQATGFKALADFGLIAGIGMVSTLIAVLAVFPSLLRLVEPTGLLTPFGARLYNNRTKGSTPFRYARQFVVVAVILSAVLLRHGPQSRFLYDFDRLGFDGGSARADSLLQAADEELGTPAVYLAPNPARALEIARELRRRQTVPGSAIGDVTTLEDLLPADMEEKLRITARLRRSITPAVIARAREPLRSSLLKLGENWPERALTLQDLPENYRLKFMGPRQTPGVFTYAFPRPDSVEGVNTLQFAREVRSVTLPPTESSSNNTTNHKYSTYYAGGWPVVYGDLVSRMIPDVRKALAFGLAVIFLLLWLTVGSLRGAFVLLLPVLATLAWTLGSLKWLGIRINPYTLIAFPVALAYATLHALVLYYRYEEEGRGSLGFVLRRTGRTALVSTLVAAAGFVPMVFSGHYGLASLGVAALVGLACGLLASLLFLGGLLGIWEARALQLETKRARARDVRTDKSAS
jgi:predicted RND superfamily exporter protein